MADDPNRDLLPVKEGSCIESCRSTVCDARTRHAVVKLDRYQLEDRYLRMRDEVLELKKLTNTQEDKIKRLATKLMRVSATPGSCLDSALNYRNDSKCPESLEIENIKLKDKITALRNQILSHKIGGRSPSRSRRLQISPSSGPTTCRSDIGRIRSSTSHLIRENDREGENAKNCIAKIEELEMEKKELKSKIENLETQIANNEAGIHRKKVSNNVEIIRLWRQMKLQNEELVACQARNATLEQQIRDFKNIVDEKTRINKEIKNALLAEKKKMTDMDEQLAKVKNSQLNLREKDEQIKDLMNEMKILHQHNAELITLSSKYSNFEMENIELRRKISEHLADNLNLKSAFTNEQANIAALQAANEKLISKLHELQTNIDSLTIQLRTFQSQTERQENSCGDRRCTRSIDCQTSKISLIENIVPPCIEDLAGRVICKICCQSSNDDQETGPIFVCREVQTDEILDTRIKGGWETMEKKSAGNCIERSMIRDHAFQHDNGNLTPEEMIKLLEKAQINTPLDAQNISRIRSSTKNSENPADSRQSCCPVKKKSCQSLGNDPCQILFALYKILCENVTNTTKFPDDASSCGCVDDYPDENNNIRNPVDSPRQDHERNRNAVIFDHKKHKSDRRSDKKKISRSPRISREKFRNSRNHNLEYSKVQASRKIDQSTEASGCNCDETEKCTFEIDCGYACALSLSETEMTRMEDRVDDCPCDIGQDCFKNFVSDFSVSIQKTFDNIHKSRVTRVDGAPYGLYKSWQKPCTVQNSKNRTTNEHESKFTVCTSAVSFKVPIFKIFLRKTSDLFGNIRQSVIRICKRFFPNYEKNKPKISTTTLGQLSNLYDKKSNEILEKKGQMEATRIKKNFNHCKNDSIREESIMEELPCISCCKKDCGDGPIVHDVGSFSMLITNDQGLFEIHIISLKLAPAATNAFRREKNSKDLSLHVTWDLWYLKKSSAPSVKYPNFNFNSSSIYRITSLFEFFDRIIERMIVFSIHTSRQGEHFCPIAQAHLNINDILDYPQNKLYYVANFSSILPCSRNEDFGQLSIWIKLSCDLQKIEEFKQLRGISNRSPLAERTWKFENEEKKDNQKNGISNENEKFHWLNNVEKKTLEKTNPEVTPRSNNAQKEKTTFQTSGIDDQSFPDASQNSKSAPLAKDINSNLFTSGESYLTLSDETSSITRALENENTPFEELRNENEQFEISPPKKLSIQQEGRSDENEVKVETASVDEFNNLIRNGTILSPRESRSSVQDLGNVFTENNWEKYRKKSIAARAKSLRTSISSVADEKKSDSSLFLSDNPTADAIILRIESISFFQTCPLLDDPKIHRIYVEFSFLGYHGVELETISVLKPLPNARAYFNYIKKFDIDEKDHSAQRNLVRNIMKEKHNSTIKFIILSEPLMEEMETKECEEVGYACFDIRNHVLQGHPKDVSLTVKNVEQTESIGTLKITVLGAEAVRRCMSDL